MSIYIFSDDKNDAWSWFAIMLSAFLLVALNVLICLICWLRKKHNDEIPKMTWATNSLYVSSESVNDIGKGVNQYPADILPEWLTSKKHMIYSQTSVEKECEIGHGEYGTVFKGKLKLGASV